ncbi:unnamed protein product [Prunus armeniaca]|uniref:Trichome birefringence-like C-terminal domain-containing protein n=1 Tax=Prunus armeniaca TaxID=36596 RepID=A0A6J5WPY7_PRUAR|nr:unnamed protein product [Prunus armeniaca]
MFVGDSLSLNQWQSLTCMLHTSNLQARYKLFKTGGLSPLTFPAYKIKVMISRNAFLVDTIATTAGRVLKLDSIESGKMWKEIDVLIFNSWHWWLHTGTKQPDRLVAYEKGLKTWARWIDNNLDTTNTRVFFQGASPDHNNDWGEPTSKQCEGQTKPMVGHQYPADGHPSVYGHGSHKDMDYSHWCLAGAPDTWNMLLYAALTQRKTN